MKVYIFCDMEGISGISGSDYVTTDGRNYALGRQYMTWDINACVRGCFAGGADTVLVRDGHGGGDNVLWSQLDQRVELVQGSGGERRMPGLEECDALMLPGYHAMAGTRGALLEHSYSSKHIQNMWMNGRLAGEFGIDAGIAADFGLPVIMTSGDDKFCAEARDWLPNVVTAQVKVGITCQGARLLPTEAAHKLIEEKAEEAVGLIGTIKPLQVERPVTIRREVVERGGIPNGFARADVKIIDGRTYETTADTVEQAFMR